MPAGYTSPDAEPEPELGGRCTKWDDGSEPAVDGREEEARRASECEMEMDPAVEGREGPYGLPPFE